MRRAGRLTVAAGAALALVALAAPGAAACTTFRLGQGDGLVVGKSYDWDNGLGAALVNRRGVRKRALLTSAGTPATWTSRYSSLTFNQYGRELPNGGMNEAGLVIEIMWLTSSRYPEADARPTLNELQWIQHGLDRYATVRELADAAPGLRVAPVYAAVHYLACDASGACAAFEYLDGALVVTRGDALVAPVLTNSPYPESAAYLKRHQGFGGAATHPPGRSSLARFVRAAERSRRRPAPADPVAAAFRTLESVAQGDYTKWQIVYEPRRRRVHFRSRGHETIKTARLDALAGACEAPVKGLDLATDRAGDVTTRFADYPAAANRRLVAASLRQLGRGVPPGLAEQLARYPDSLPCAASP